MNSQQSLLNTRQMTSAREMNAFKRARAIKEAGIRRVVPPPKPKPDFKDVEFSLTDESRNWVLHVGSCPVCEFGGTQIMRVVHKPSQRLQFSVECGNMACRHRTPVFDSSQLAIRHWKLVAALSK